MKVATLPSLARYFLLLNFYFAHSLFDLRTPFATNERIRTPDSLVSATKRLTAAPRSGLRY